MSGMSLTLSNVPRISSRCRCASYVSLLRFSPISQDSKAAQYPHICQVDAEPLHLYKPGGYHPIHIGDTLGDGRYQILQKLGWGAYSTVWAARDQRLSRNVAIKINTSECSSVPRELRILRYLNADSNSMGPSQAIVRFYDDFRVTGPNGMHHCVVTELLGPSVYDYLDRRSTNKLPAAWAKHITIQLLRAVDHLHQRTIGHGDIHMRNIAFTHNSWDGMSEEDLMSLLGKPDTADVSSIDGSRTGANLPRYLVWPSSLPVSVPTSELPEVRLIDFGQAFTVNDKPMTLATPLPLRAPEVLFEDEWDYRADLWTLGCTIFELFAGQPPFDTIMTNKDILVGQMIEEIGALPERWVRRREGIQDPNDDRYSLEEWLAELNFDESVVQLTPNQLNSLAEILRMLMRFEPAQRVSAASVLNHGWLDTPQL